MSNLDQLEKTVFLNKLYDFYKKLLSDKQREYFELYFLEDLTMQEIAEEFHISRAAVMDGLNKAVAALNYFEDNLKLNEQNEKLKKIVENFKNGKITDIELITNIEREIL